MMEPSRGRPVRCRAGELNARNEFSMFIGDAKRERILCGLFDSFSPTAPPRWSLTPTTPGAGGAAGRSAENERVPPAAFIPRAARPTAAWTASERQDRRFPGGASEKESGMRCLRHREQPIRGTECVCIVGPDQPGHSEAAPGRAAEQNRGEPVGADE